MRAGGVYQLLVDETLCGRMPPAAFSNRNTFRPRCEGQHIFPDERVVQNDIRLGEQLCGTQRQQIRRTGAGTDQPHLAGPSGVSRL
jgi:hypothetical protein